MPADADKVRMIDGEIAALQALLVGDGEFEGLQSSLVRGSSRRTVGRTAKHKLPGRNKKDVDDNVAENLDHMDAFIKDCVVWAARFTPRENLYNRSVLAALKKLAGEGLELSKSLVGKRLVTELSVDVYQTDDRVSYGKFYPAIAYIPTTSPVGTPDQLPRGFEFLQFRLTEKHNKEWDNDLGYPAMYDEWGTYHTLYSFTIPALLMNCMTKGSPRLNIHVICKGFREFNADDLLKQATCEPKPGKDHEDPGKETLIWYVDTDEVKNIDAFVTSVINSKAFEKAVALGSNGTLLRRIVVWIMLKGHMQSFCWDTIYDGSGERVRDILYIVTTTPQKNFVWDINIHDNIIAAFQKQMVKAGLLSGNVTLIPELKCRARLRRSMIDNTPDIACVTFTGFATFFLMNVSDITNWDGRQIDSRFWDYCRCGYASFENKLIALLKAYIRDNKAIWICPELQAHHVNINDVYLMSVDLNGDKEKLTYDWDRGWQTSPME